MIHIRDTELDAAEEVYDRRFAVVRSGVWLLITGYCLFLWVLLVQFMFGWSL